MISHKSFLRGGLRTCARSIGGFGWVPGQGPGGDLTWHLQLFVAKKHVDLMMAYPFDREEELVSLLRTILGQGTERLLQARQIMLELQSRAERTIHCLHKLRALVPSEVKWLSVFNKAKRQCVVASGVVQTVPGLAACGAVRWRKKASFFVVDVVTLPFSVIFLCQGPLPLG